MTPKLSIEAVALLFLAMLVFSATGSFYVFTCSNPAAKRKRAVWFMWLSAVVNGVAGFFIFEEIEASYLWLFLSFVVTIINSRNIKICIHCGAIPMTHAQIKTYKAGQCARCGALINQTNL